MTATPIIEVFPEEGFDEQLDKARVALSVGDNQINIVSALRELGAKALIITPEYNESRAKDTGRDILFHVLLDGNKVPSHQKWAFQDNVSQILGEEGFAVSFGRDYQPTLPLYFGSSDDNPFSKIIDRVFGASAKSGFNPK